MKLMDDLSPEIVQCQQLRDLLIEVLIKTRENFQVIY